MRVIRTPDRNWSKQIDCLGCEAGLELEIEDLYKTTGGVEFRCGHCGVANYYEINFLVPHKFQRSIRSA
jgi:transcription elongation factor Elf1